MWQEHFKTNRWLKFLLFAILCNISASSRPVALTASDAAALSSAPPALPMRSSAMSTPAPSSTALHPGTTTSSSSSSKQPLLQFNVTPPKPAGPTEAERKIEDLTRQIEEQMEKEEKAEYFGEKNRGTHSFFLFFVNNSFTLLSLLTSFSLSLSLSHSLSLSLFFPLSLFFSLSLFVFLFKEEPLR